MLKVTKVAGGQRNITIHVSGMIHEELQPTPIDIGDKGAKLASLVWLIQEKLGFHLMWNLKDLLLPMESRNSVRFDSPLRPPEDWDGKMWIMSFNWGQPPVTESKAFFITLDFDR